MANDKFFKVKNGIEVPLGSAASPSITIAGDLDTGVFSGGVDSISFTTGGVERLNVDSSGDFDFNGGTLSNVNFSGGTTFDLGSAASPSITFTGDLNTGVYSPGSDTLGFSTAGSEVLRLTGGQVRASQDGTVSLPSFAFQGDVDTGFYLAATGEIGVATSGTLRAEFKTNGLAITSGTLLLPSGSAGTPAMRFSSDGDTGIYNAGTNQLAISTGGVQRVTVDSAGNVGIGDTSPNHLLDLDFADAGTIDNTDTLLPGTVDNIALHIQNTDNTATQSGIVLATRTASSSNWAIINEWTGSFVGDLVFRTRTTGSASAEALRIKSSGLHTATNTSIFLQGGSASSPSLRFSLDDDTGIFRVAANTLGISAGGANQLQIQSGIVRSFANIESVDGSAASPSIRFTSDPDTGIFRLSSDQLGFTTGGVHRLTIDNSNNLVFPVNNSTAYWTGGNGIINTASSCYVNIDADNTDADTERFQVSKNRAGNSGGTTLFTVAESGTVTLNTYGAGTLSTDGSGNISASDARLKTILNREVLGRDNIMALNPVWYDWNEDSGFSTEYSELGFTAQGVAEVIPEASPGTDETVNVRNYHDRAIIASLVKHNQELEQDKEDLQSKVSELEGTLSQVLSRLNALEDK